MSIFESVLIWFFTWLDGVVYGLIGTIYSLLMRISDATFFNEGIFRQFSTRIYSILGIFMLFRVSFSLITYVINPDDFSDKSKGFQNIVSRIIITLLLLIITPTIFVRARELQKIVLDNGVIENLILGMGTSENVVDPDLASSSGDTKNMAGQRLSVMLLSTFLTPDETIFPECINGVYTGAGVVPACLQNLSNESSLDGQPLSEYFDVAWKYKDVSILLDADLLGATKVKAGYDTKTKMIKYQYLVTTLVGLFVCYIFVIFCVDIAVRSVKLGFLELIAPIPILGNIDPKAGKDGTFNKWIKITLNTYLDLFLRLAAIYFAIFIFDNVDLVVRQSGNAFSDAVVKIFIILGALLFAKQLPELLKEFFPGMGKGDFTLSWRKKMENVPVGGKALGALPTGLAAAGGAAIGAGVANTVANKGNVLSGLAGASSALARGTKSSLAGKKASEVYKNSYGGAIQARGRRADTRASGATMLGPTGARMQSALGIHTSAEKTEKQIKNYEAFDKQVKGVMSLAETEMIKNDNMEFTNLAGKNMTMAEFKTAKKYFESFSKSDTSRMSPNEAMDYASDVARLEAEIKKNEKIATQAFVSQTMNGTLAVDDNIKAQMTAYVGSLQRMTSESNDEVLKKQDLSIGPDLGKRLKDASDIVNTARVKTEHSERTATARANAEAAKRESSGGKK